MLGVHLAAFEVVEMSDLPPVGRDGWRTVGIASAASLW